MSHNRRRPGDAILRGWRLWTIGYNLVEGNQSSLRFDPANKWQVTGDRIKGRRLKGKVRVKLHHAAGSRKGHSASRGGSGVSDFGSGLIRVFRVIRSLNLAALAPWRLITGCELKVERTAGSAIHCLLFMSLHSRDNITGLCWQL